MAYGKSQMKTVTILTQSFFTLAIALIGFETLGSPSAPEGLLVNGVSQPLADDRDAIRFTWMSKDGARGETQTAYQILVSTNSEGLAAGTADSWDSGKVDSD